MNQVATYQTTLAEAEAAAHDLAKHLQTQLQGHPPDAAILFASSQYDFRVLLKTFKHVCRPQVLVGCSSAGEFTERSQEVGSACAIVFRSDEMCFAAGLGQGIKQSRSLAAQRLVSSFKARDLPRYPYRFAMVLTDALGGYADDLVEELTLATAGRYQIFGGGAGDDARFARTHVFYEEEAYTDAAVALEILSTKPLGIGVQHGWRPATRPMRVTEAVGMRLVSLNALPTAEVFEGFAASRGEHFDHAKPLDFFLHHILGIETGQGYKLRVPLSVEADGSVVCAAEIPVGALVSIMETNTESSTAAAMTATRAALQQLGSRKPKAALFFDCVATRLRLGREFGLELETLKRALPHSVLVGCNTYGQIARVEGQFSGFHNCTAVVCLVPE